MKSWKNVIAGVTAVLMTISLTACGSGSADATTEGSQGIPTEAALSGEPLELTLTINAEVTTLDGSLMTYANDMMVFTNTQTGLYAYDENGELGLGLAESVDISEDGMTYIYTLKDATWSDGTPITADDFEFSWKRLGDPQTGSAYGTMVYVAGIKNAADIYFNGADIETLGVTAIDDKTLKVELERPVPYLPSLLTGSYFMPINREFCLAQGDQYGLTKDAVMYSGAFTISEWVPGGTTVVLTKNPNYYDAENVTVDKITFETIKDNQQMIMSWESQEVDQISISGDLVSQYADDPAYVPVSSTMVIYMTPNMLTPGLDNLNMRKALALCFDKQAICDSILKNGSYVADYFVAKDFAADENGVFFRDAANATYLETDKEAAREYYDKACEELGQDTFTFEILYTDTEANRNICQFLQSEIQTTLPGVTITLKPQTSKGKSELAKAHDFDIILGGWGADYQDATTYLDLFTSVNTPNSSWQNDEYDALMDAVSGELAGDNQARIQNMIKAESILLNDAAIFPMYQQANSYLINPELNVPRSTTGSFLWRFATRK